VGGERVKIKSHVHAARFENTKKKKQSKTRSLSKKTPSEASPTKHLSCKLAEGPEWMRVLGREEKERNERKKKKDQE
jgi:hypothetical protein